MKTLAKIALTGALAVTGLGVGAVSDSPVNPLSATQADAASAVYTDIITNGTYDRYLSHSGSVTIENQTTSHQGRTMSWEVYDENSPSTVLQSGSATLGAGSTSGSRTYYTTNGQTFDTSKLAAGKSYIMLYSYNAGGVTYRDQVRLIKGTSGYTSTIEIGG